jgi:hypothetical protein
LEALLIAEFRPKPSLRAGYGDSFTAPVDCAAKSISLPANRKPNPLSIAQRIRTSKAPGVMLSRLAEDCNACRL